MEKRILLSSPTTHDEEMNYIREAFERNWVAPLGFNCNAFEEELCGYIACENDEQFYGLALSSGTAALHLAMKLAGVRSGDIVLCSDMTFAATVNPVSYEGAVQVFVDSEEETWNMDPKALEKAFEKYPQARVVVLAHLYGTPSKMDEILQICEKHGAILIEDAAEALSASYRNRQCGSFGHYNIFSFNGNKIITTSGGGMLLTRNAESREKALFWATQAREQTHWYEHEQIGYNYRMSNVLAGIGRGQLRHLEEHRTRKEAIYRRYQAGLKDLPVAMNPFLPDSVPNFWLSCITINRDCPVTPLDIYSHLEKNNVESRLTWKPMHMQPVFRDRDFITVRENPVDEDIFARGLCLPSDIKMTEEEQDYVIRLIHECF